VNTGTVNSLTNSVVRSYSRPPRQSQAAAAAAAEAAGDGEGKAAGEGEGGQEGLRGREERTLGAVAFALGGLGVCDGAAGDAADDTAAAASGRESRQLQRQRREESDGVAGVAAAAAASPVETAAAVVETVAEEEEAVIGWVGWGRERRRVDGVQELGGGGVGAAEHQNSSYGSDAASAAFRAPFHSAAQELADARSAAAVAAAAVTDALVANGTASAPATPLHLYHHGSRPALVAAMGAADAAAAAGQTAATVTAERLIQRLFAASAEVFTQRSPPLRALSSSADADVAVYTYVDITVGADVDIVDAPTAIDNGRSTSPSSPQTPPEPASGAGAEQQMPEVELMQPECSFCRRPCAPAGACQGCNELFCGLCSRLDYEVGLYKLNPVYPQPLNLRCDILVLSLCFPKSTCTATTRRRTRGCSVWTACRDTAARSWEAPGAGATGGGAGRAWRRRAAGGSSGGDGETR
jgi:hypothetical protein